MAHPSALAGSLILLHGFTQTGDCWEPVSTTLRDAGHEVLTPDLDGHGLQSNETGDLWGVAERLAEVISTTATPPTTVVGYSLGGRVALHLALAHPAVVDRLVLVGATPGLVDPVERERRRQADEQLAEQIEHQGVAAFLDDWLALPLFAGLGAERAHRDLRLANSAAGLATSLRRCGTGAQEPLWDRLGEITCAVLLVTGEHDPKFTDEARRMAPLLGGPSDHLVIDGAGHTAHLEDPETFTAALQAWLSESSGGRRPPQTGP